MKITAVIRSAKTKTAPFSGDFVKYPVAIAFLLFIPLVQAHHSTSSVASIDWVDTALETSGTWGALDIADGGTKVGVLYGSATETKFALFESGVWETHSIDTYAGTNEYQEGILTYGGDDTWLVAYEISSLDDLMFARTTNDGDTWTVSTIDGSEPINAFAGVEFQIISSTDYVLAEPPDYYRSTDSGANWVFHDVNFPSISSTIRAIHVVSGTGATTQLAAIVDNSGKPQMVRSLNNGGASPTGAPYSFKGNWDSTVTYTLRNVVDYQSVRYEALQSTINDAPDVSSTDWAVFSNEDNRNEVAEIVFTGSPAGLRDPYFLDGYYYFGLTVSGDRGIWRATGDFDDTMTWYNAGIKKISIGSTGNSNLEFAGEGAFIVATNDDVTNSQNDYGFSDNSGANWVWGNIPPTSAQYQYDLSPAVMPAGGYSNGKYYYAFQSDDGSLHILSGIAGTDPNIPPAENEDNLLGSMIVNLNESWGFDWSIVLGIALIGMVGVGFAKIGGGIPLLIALGAFLGVIFATQLGLLADWVIYVCVFLIIAVAGVTLFERKRAADE